MVKKKTKEFNPMDFVMEHGKIQIGTMAVTGLASKMPSSPQSSAIQSSMGTMTLIPTIHGVSGVMGSLGNLERQYKKKKR